MYSLRDKMPEFLSGNKTKLAETLGVHRSTIYRWIKDPDQIPTGILRTIVDLNGYMVLIQPKETKYTL